MKKFKKAMTALAIIAVVGMPMGNAMAAGKTFGPYTVTTKKYSEEYKAVTTKAKADNEQNWYVTLTSSKGLGTKGIPRAIFTSATSAKKASSSSSKLGLYSTMTGVQKMAYPSATYYKKGAKCKLYITGHNNASKNYTITVSGRYSS